MPTFPPPSNWPAGRVQPFLPCGPPSTTSNCGASPHALRSRRRSAECRTKAPCQRWPGPAGRW